MGDFSLIRSLWGLGVAAIVFVLSWGEFSGDCNDVVIHGSVDTFVNAEATSAAIRLLVVSFVDCIGAE